MKDRQIIKYIGFFLVVPFIFLPLGVVNIRIDDILVLFLFFSALLCLKEYKINNKLFFYILLFVVFVIYGVFIRTEDVSTFDNYPLIRIIGIIIYFICLSLTLRNELLYSNFLLGVYRGALFLSVVVCLALLYHLFLVGGVSGLYTLKDSLRILGTFNPNTYGALFLFSSFCSFTLYVIKRKSIFKFFSVFFILLPFVFLIKRDMFGVLVGLVYLYIVNRKNLFYKRILVVLVCYISMYTINLFIELWYTPEFTTLMAHRVEIYDAAVNGIMNRLQGNGIGSEIEILTQETGRANVAHNSFLSMSLELGFFNCLVFLFSLVCLFKIIKAKHVRFYLIAFFIESLLGNGFYFYKYHFLFLLLAILFHHFYKSKLILKEGL